jgi:ABC-type multidrug transport system fused ATPase/permease subunit
MDAISTPWSIVVGVIIVAVLALTLWFIAKKRRQSHRLQERFGSEYGRTVNALGGQRKAESDLKAREKRVERLTLTSLSSAEAARFSQAWNALQSRFVDNPKGVVTQADQLVRELMLKRGYPMGDFERQAGDISVDHPTIVASYRAAQAITVRHDRGPADTEELRQAVVHYRALFDELLETKEGKQEAALPVEHVAVQA